MFCALHWNMAHQSHESAPLVLQALAACGFLKAYQPREDGDGNDSVSITAKDIEVQGVDKWTKQCSVPYTGTWHIKVMKAHYDDFVKFYHDLGEPPESWKKVKVTREKSRARVFESPNHMGDAPTHNKVCCLDLKPSTRAGATRSSPRTSRRARRRLLLL